MPVSNPFIPIAGSGLRYATPSTLAADETLVPRLPDTFDLGSPTNMYRKGYLSELDAVLFAKNTITLLGGWFYVTKAEGAIEAAVAAADTTIDFCQAMTPNDFVVFRSSLQVEYVQVGTLVSGTVYNVTRNLDGSGANDWPAGALFAVLGNTGDGRIELNAYDTPRISITEQGATYNAQTERMRLGDLALWQSAGLSGYGWAVGDYAGGKYAYYSPADGLVVRGTINADAGYLGTLSISGVLSIGASGGIYQGSGTFAAPNVGLKIYNSGGVGLLETWGSNGAGGWAKQAYMDTTGAIVAGAGAVLLNKDGVTVKRGATSHDLTPLPNRIKFIDAATGDISTEMASYLGADDVSGVNTLSIRANLTHRSPSGNEAGRIILTALSASASYPSAAITVGSDLGNGGAGDCYVSITGAKLSVAGAVNVGGDLNVTGTGGNVLLKTSANRPGVTRLYRFDDDLDYSVRTYWNGSYWYLGGYNGDTWHAPCQVGYADNAGFANSFNLTLTAPIKPILTKGTYVCGIDANSTGTTYGYTNTFTPWGVANRAALNALVFIFSATPNSSGVYLIANNAVVLIAGLGPGVFTTTKNNPGTINFYMDTGSVPTVQNNRNETSEFRVFAIGLRQ